MKPWRLTRLLVILTFLGLFDGLHAQVSQPAVIWVQADPAGACASFAPLRINIAVNPPTLWACQIPTMMWVQINTGSSGTGNPGGSNFSTQYNAGAGVFGGTGPGLSGQLYLAQGAGTQALFKTMSGDATITNLGAISVTASGGMAFGTAAFQNTGTSGGNLGLLNGNLTFSGTDIFSAGVTMSGLSAGTQVSCIGLDAGNHLVLVASACGTSSSSVTLQTNTVNNSSQTTLNLLNSAAFNGLTATLTNTSAGNVQLGFSGTLGNGGLTNSTITFGATSVALGATVTNLNTVNIGPTTPGTGAFTTLSASTSLTLSAISGSTQCLQVNSSGVVSGTGGTCAGGGNVTWQVGGSTVVTGNTFNDPGTGSGITHTLTNVGGVATYSPSVNYSVVTSTACLQSGVPLYAHSITGNTIFTATLAGSASCGSVLTSYTTGMVVPLVTDTSTTTTATLNIDTVGAITLKQHDCSTSIGTDVTANQMDLFWYNGTFFCEVLLPPGTGMGSVTSVSFTGGLISVANPTTTPALTVAGTSGGIPYFSSSSTWASSGVLTANLPVLGGGAGSAPIVGTVTGNTTRFATSTGALTSGHCAQWDASGNLVDAGAACGTGSGANLGSGPQLTALPVGSAVQPIENIFPGPLAQQTASGIFPIPYGPAVTTNGHLACWSGTVGAALTDCAGGTATSVVDSSSLNILTTVHTASAVDWFSMTNGATANPATVSLNATGSDANINIQLTTKGTGTVLLPSGISAGTSPPPCAAGTGGVLCIGEGTAPSSGLPAATVDGCYADSTLHGIKCSYNNGSLLPLPLGPASTTNLHLAQWSGTAGNLLVDLATTGTGSAVLATAPTINGQTFGTAAGSAVVRQTVASGTTAASGAGSLNNLGSIASTACATLTISATGVASTDTITFTPNASIKAVVGFTPATTGGISLTAYPTSGNINFDACNWSTGSLTIGTGAVLNWSVSR